MGCGTSRGTPVTATLALVTRVEKERDDASLEPVQLRRLGIRAYDDFFTDFEAAVNAVINFNNILHDAIWDTKAALAFASSPEPEYGLNVVISTDGVRSVPQILIDVFCADGNSRPLPCEVRHLLTSRPGVAEADRKVGEAVQDLKAALQSHPAPMQLLYDESKLLLLVIPAGNGSSLPGATRQYQRLNQLAARVSSALAAMRKVAPGLRLLVKVVPTPAFGARTFSWQLEQRLDVAELYQQQAKAVETPSHAPPAARKPNESAAARKPFAAIKRMASPLQLASAHGSGAIVEAAATVAQQAAAIAAAVTTVAAPLIQLQLEGGRRLIAVTSPASFTEAAHTSVSQCSALSNNVILRTLSLNRSAPPDVASGGTSPTACKGIAAAARADEAAAVLRRAVSSANHALFRLSKCGMTGSNSDQDATALRKGDLSAYSINKAVALVLEATILATGQAAGAAATSATTVAATAGSISGFANCNSAGGNGTQPLVNELVSADPQLRTASESGSVISSSVQGGTFGGGYACSTVSDCFSNGAPVTPPLSKDCGSAIGGDRLTPGWSWSWDWGIHPRVEGVSFPDCLPPKARAVYDAVNRVVDAARSITDQLPLVQREVLVLVEDAGSVFRKCDDKLATAARDMMSAGRMRAALDRNANTIRASPALVRCLHAAVSRLMEELRRGAEQMRMMVHGDSSNGVEADMRSSKGEDRYISRRGSGNRSIIARQVNDAAAAVAAAAVAEMDNGGWEADTAFKQSDSGLASESGSNDIAGGAGGARGGDDSRSESVDDGCRRDGRCNGGKFRRPATSDDWGGAAGRVKGDPGNGPEGPLGCGSAYSITGSSELETAISRTCSDPASDVAAQRPASVMSRRVMLPPLPQGT